MSASGPLEKAFDRDFGTFDEFHTVTAAIQPPGK